MSQSDLLLIFLLKHRRPERYRPPRATAAVVTTAPEDLRAVEEGRRIAALSHEEIETELREIERRHEIADAAPAEVFPASNRGNGANY